ncbi:hypothetical protein [Nonomuraea aurantiaca]|uniref:hypothetical protein n=1 Tax=Nonomuraea aurantiaca TaxID=2878562 RepID=UPI001CDA2AFB|nr:hypothetical protein [Nonomuraea aurantiaca]MCA2223624.1 hypothetical protein [Nonomuraea aurantiaca]
MLKEIFVTGALAVTAFVPSAAALAQPDKAHALGNTTASTSLTHCTSTSTGKPCKWLEGKYKKCLWCKSKKGGYTRSYCEDKNMGSSGKTPEKPKQQEGILCKGDLDEAGTSCTRCVNLKTGKIFSTTCKGEKPGDPAP